MSSELEVSSRDLCGSEIALLLQRARDRLPFPFRDGCWRVATSKIAMDFDTKANFRKFVLERVSDEDCLPGAGLERPART